MDEAPIHREEVVGLLFAVHDISQTPIRIEELLSDDEPEEDDEG
jgi:hypothetical protein